MISDMIHLTSLASGTTNTVGYPVQVWVYEPVFAGPWQPSAVSAQPAAFITAQAQHWVIDAARQLDALGRLRSGWDSYGGKPLRPEAKALTVKAIQSLERLDLPVPLVALGSGGGVQFEWEHEGRELDLDFGSHGDRIGFLKCPVDGDMEEGVADGIDDATLRKFTNWLLFS